MSSDVFPKLRKSRNNTSFWRACGYLGPYRRIVTISIICAFFVGLITAIGLTAMLPILRVLLSGDTLQGYVDRQIVQHRLNLSLDERTPKIARLNDDSPAAKAGLELGDDLSPLDTLTPTTAVSRTIPTRHGPVALALPPMKWYWALAWGTARRIVQPLPSKPVQAVAVCYLIIFVLSLVGSIIRFFQEYLSDKAAISAINDIRRHLYDHVLHTPLSFFGTQGTSDVTSRLVGDSQNLQDGFKTVLGQSIQEPIKAFFFFAVAMTLSWRLTLVIIIFAPLMAVTIKKFGKKMRRASRAAMQRSSDMLGQIEGTLIGIRVVKSAGAERFERRRYTTVMNKLKAEQLKMARYEAFATPTMETVAMLVIGIVLVFAAYQVLVSHLLSSAEFLLIFGCLAGMGESLRRVSKVNTVLQRSNAAAQRIFEIIDLPMERRRLRLRQRNDTAARIKLPSIQRDIVFQDVSFSYPQATQPAVKDVSLTVKKGASVAIVGRNGSGKTTLMALLPRFYDPSSGRITIDGIDIKDATLRSLRGQISIVTQDTVVFPGTIAENIAYGDPLGSRDRIIHAAKRAFCHDFIMEKPNNYDALLDGLGGQLSGGQKQRINIARAIYRASPILILDEATSQVDAESEHLIQTAIEALMHERTTFVIAHRFSTILSADTIIVMERGQIVGQGKHEELLQSCGTYANLYERQLFAPKPEATPLSTE